MGTLASNVTIGGTTYAAGTTPPDAIADRIRNPQAWVGGVAPALVDPTNTPVHPEQLATVRGRIVYVTNHGRRIAAIVPVPVAEQIEQPPG